MQSTRRSTESREQAAPPPFGHRSDHGGDRRRTADDEHRRHIALGLEEESEDARQDHELTLGELERTARSGEAGRRRTLARRRRPEREEIGRRGRLRLPLVDSVDAEVQHGEAMKMASSACSGTAGNDGTVRRPERRTGAKARVRVRVAGCGEEQGREESAAEARGTSLSSSGRQGGRQCGAAGASTVAAWRQWKDCGDSDGTFLKTPLPYFFFPVLILKFENSTPFLFR